MKSIETDFKDAEATLKAVLASIERWYEQHFHRASATGTAPLSSTDKASLVAHVTQAIHSEDTQS